MFFPHLFSLKNQIVAPSERTKTKNTAACKQKSAREGPFIDAKLKTCACVRALGNMKIEEAK